MKNNISKKEQNADTEHGVFYSPNLFILTEQGWKPFRNLESTERLVYLEDKFSSSEKIKEFSIVSETLEKGCCIYRDSEYWNFYLSYLSPFASIVHPVEDGLPNVDLKLDYVFEISRKSSDKWLHVYNHWKEDFRKVVNDYEGMRYYIYCILLFKGSVKFNQFFFSLYNDAVRVDKVERILESFDIDYETWKGDATYKDKKTGKGKKLDRVDFRIKPCQNLGDGLYMKEDGGGYLRNFFNEISESEKIGVYCFIYDYILQRRREVGSDYISSNILDSTCKKIKTKSPFFSSFIEQAFTSLGFNTQMSFDDSKGVYTLKVTRGHMKIGFSPTITHKDSGKILFNKLSKFYGVMSDNEVFFIKGDIDSYYYLNYGRISKSIKSKYEAISREELINE